MSSKNNKDSTTVDNNNNSNTRIIPPCPYTSPNGYTVDKIQKIEGTTNDNLYVGVYKGNNVRINPDTWEPLFMNKEKDCPIHAGKLLMPNDKATVQKAKNGNKKSLETKRIRKTLREELTALLSSDIKDKNGNPINMQTAMSTAIIKQAIMGNVNAFTVIRDTIGEKPTENITVNAEPVETEKKLTAEEIAKKYLNEAPQAQKEPIETEFVPEKG